MELKGVLLSQPWGMFGVDGLAARLYALSQEKRRLDNEIPFGEYIIGGDKFNKTYVVTKDEYLNTLFKRLTPEELGETSVCEFGNTLPFSVKFLSIRIPAPFLCYPPEDKGTIFHNKNAKIFRTGGVRHQVVIALKDFMMLMGFRSLDFIANVLKHVPEFKILVDGTLIDTFLQTRNKDDFLKIFKDLLDNLPSRIEYTSKILKSRLINAAPSSLCAFHPMKLFERLLNDYPSDVGVFLPYFLNVVKIRRLEAIIIPAGTPYAYLYGEAIECYNNVENAARAAFCCCRDLDRFFLSLDLQFWTIEEIKETLSVELRSAENNINEYLTPSPFYQIFIGRVPSWSQQSLPRLLSFSIVIIIEGEGKINEYLQVVPGSAYLFFKKEKITFDTKDRIWFIQVSINLLA